MLKMTSVKLEKISNIDMSLFIKRGLRGGISCIAKKYAKVNSKRMKIYDNFDVNSISEKSPIGYILEVGLEYPAKLHVLHSDYPLAPEKLAVPYDML